MMILTDKEFKSAEVREKSYRMKDERGLFLEVRPSGKKVWRMRYWFKSKENLLTFGEYPLISLKEARIKRDEARRLLTNGIDPAIQRDLKRMESTVPTFRDIALEFCVRKQKESTSPKARHLLEMRLKKYILPDLGDIPPDEITAPMILKVVRQQEERGFFETARRVNRIIGQVFRFGIVTGRATRDPSHDLRGALLNIPGRHFASIKEPEKLGALLRAIEAYSGSEAVRTGLMLLAYTFVRPGELRHAEWPELSLEADKKEWRISAEKMKMKRLHIVPLSNQAASLFQRMMDISGHGRYVFPSARTRNGSRPLSDSALLAALRSLGYSGDEMTAHGFRHTASTLLNESGLWSSDAIERQLAHVDRNKIRAIYNAAEYMPERRKMMTWWADYLDELKEGKSESV